MKNMLTLFWYTSEQSSEVCFSIKIRILQCKFLSKCSIEYWYIEVKVYWFLKSHVFNVYQQVSSVYIQIGTYKFLHITIL